LLRVASGNPAVGARSPAFVHDSAANDPNANNTAPAAMVSELARTMRVSRGLPRARESRTGRPERSKPHAHPEPVEIGTLS
jgi:hypothetical protein